MNKINYNNELENLRNKTQEFNINNIIKMKSKSEIIYALSKKYNNFFEVIKNGIQYRQFLSGFLHCIVINKSEPKYIKIYNSNADKYYYTNYNKISAEYNSKNLLPWNDNNLILCKNKKINEKNNFDVNIKFLIESISILFPKFFKKFNNLLLLLIERFNNISLNELYNYLIKCGDILNNIKKEKATNILSKKKIYKFLNLFTYEQLISLF